jgi:hypothetical protein
MQVERFGNHLFDNGSVILGGEISESLINYAVPDNDSVDLSGLVGEKITDGTVVAQAYHTLDDDQTVFFQYITQGTFSSGVELGTTGENHSGITFMPSSVGMDATLFTINEGVYYIDGYFVLSDTQSIVPYNEDDATKIFANPTNSIGWKIERNIKTADDDNTLRDPASGFYNYNAPGADRYGIYLDINRIPFEASLGESQGLTFDNEDFVELVRIVGGSTTKKINNTNYADIEETFARRTFDESGNYTVNTPGIEVKSYDDVYDVIDNTKFAVGVGANKSYVGGYEIDTQNNVYLSIDKPREVGVINADYIDVDFGNYVIIDSSSSQFGTGTDSSDTSTGFSVFTSQKVLSLQKSDGTGIGTTNFRTIKNVDGEVRVYIFNTKMNDGESFSTTNKMVSGSVSFALQSSGGNIGPFNSGSRSLIVPTINKNIMDESGIIHPSSITNIVVQKEGYVFIPEAGTTGEIEVSYTDFLEGDANYSVVLGDSPSGSAELLDDSDYDITVNNEGDTKTLTLTLNGITVPVGGITASVIYPIVYSALDYNGTIYDVYRTITDTSITNKDVTSLSTETFMNGNTYATFELPNSNVHTWTNIRLSNDNTDVDTTDLIFDDGQTETAFRRSKIYLPTNVLSDWDSGNSSTIRVDYSYWEHESTSKGPVTIDSWIDAGVAYEDIPVFTDPDSGNRYDMRSHIDYRPVEERVSGSGDSTTYSFTEFGIPYHTTGSTRTRISYSHYLPRIDKVCLCKDRTYRVVKGTSSIPPSAPQTTSDDMDLYQVIMKPYVFDIDEDVKFKYIDNKRFTMRQIGEIEDNLDRIEIDKHLETLKNDAYARASALNESIMEEGIFVDDFSGHAYADVTNKDHNCSMDFTTRGLYPPYTSISVKQQPNSIGNNTTTSDDRIVTYKYNEELVNGVESSGVLKATGSIQINPYGNTDFLGTMKLNPSSDVWYDNEKTPKVLVNTFGENNAWEISGLSWNSDGKKNGFGTEHYEWITHWLGEEVVNNDTFEVDPYDRSYKSPIKTAKAKLPGRITETINDRLIDKSVVPYMREVGITFDAFGLLPGSTVYAFFDGDKVGESSGYLVNSIGSVSGNVTIPSSTYTTGEKLFRITDSATDDVDTANTSADSKFYAQGTLNTTNSSVSSVRPPITRRKSVNSEDIVDDYFEQTLDNNFSSVVNGLEPLSQEFVVDYGVYPQGVFLSSIELFFKELDSSLPITIQIRPIVNGLPHPSIVVPFSEITIKPTIYKVGPDATKSTKFSFSSPVYLPHGRYALCLISNSPNNVIFKATDGELILDSGGNTTGELYSPSNISTGINLGSLFMPLNNGSRTEKTNETIKVNINRCSFITTGSEYNNRYQVKAVLEDSSDLYANHTMIVSNEQPFTSNETRISYNVYRSGTWEQDIIPNKRIMGTTKVIESEDDLLISCLLGVPTNNILSPVIDLDRLSFIVAERESYSSDETDGSVLGETQIDSSGSNTISRYVSKIVTLNSGQANDIAVFLDVAPKQNTNEILVFVKVDDLNDSFDDNNWIQLGIDGNSDYEIGGSSSLDTFVFRPTSSIGSYSRYSVKIVMNVHSSNSENQIPIIKDLRAVPLS